MKKVVSSCCHANVKLSEIVGDHKDVSEHWDSHEFYICMKCGEICETMMEKQRKKKEDYENSN